MGSIVPYKDGWRVQIDRKGVRKSAVWNTHREANAWMVDKEREIDAGRATHDHTFGELCAEYERKVSSKKAGHRWEKLRIAAFLRHFQADTKLTAISQPQIAAWRDARLQTVSGSTVVREVNLLRAMFLLARDEWHWLDETANPFRKVKMPAENEYRESLWGWRDIKRVLRHRTDGGKTQEVIDAFHIALRTGMRLQEVLTAPQALNATSRVVTLQPDQTKPQRRVHIPIGRIAMRLVQRPPFTVGPNEASTLFAKLTAQLGIEGLTFHDTRATALTHLSRKVNVMTLAKISQHKDIRILQRRYYRESASDIAKRI